MIVGWSVKQSSGLFYAGRAFKSQLNRRSAAIFPLVERADGEAVHPTVNRSAYASGSIAKAGMRALFFAHSRNLSAVASASLMVTSMSR